MELKGKKIVFLGDSITEGVGTSAPDKRYWEVVSQKTGAVCCGFGIGGTRIARQQHPVEGALHDFNHFLTRVDKMDADADVVMVLGGVNDFGHGDAPFGTMDDRTQDSFYGGLHTLYTALVEKYPTARIVIMTPLHWDVEDNPKTTADGKTLVLKDYVNAIREVAEYYSFPVLDLFASSGIQPKIAFQKEYYMPDGLHPSDNGNARMAECIVAFLNKL